mgnify:CR=1 FL=1
MHDRLLFGVIKTTFGNIQERYRISVIPLRQLRNDAYSEQRKLLNSCNRLLMAVTNAHFCYMFYEHMGDDAINRLTVASFFYFSNL